jgi:hypothetical protein
MVEEDGVKTKPSKRRKFLTHRQLYPDDPWNLIKIRRWARRAPLHVVISLDKLAEKAIFVASIDVRGHGRHIYNRRSSWTSSGHPTSDRQGRYIALKMMQHAKRDLLRPFTSIVDTTPTGLYEQGK